MSDLYNRLKEKIRPLTCSEVIELRRHGLGEDLESDRILEISEMILDAIFPETNWRDLPLPEAQELCISVFKLTFKKFKADMFFGSEALH